MSTQARDQLVLIESAFVRTYLDHNVAVETLCHDSPSKHRLRQPVVVTQETSYTESNGATQITTTDVMYVVLWTSSFSRVKTGLGLTWRDE